MDSSSPQHIPQSPIYDYSTLEAADASHFQRESTLEPVPVYQAHKYPSDQKESYRKVYVHASNSEVERSDAGSAGGKRRRICGMTLAVAILVAMIVLLVIVGGVVGGVVGSGKKDSGGSRQKADSSSTSSISSESITVTRSTTNTASTTSTSSSETLSVVTNVPVPLFFANRWNTFDSTGNTDNLENATHYGLQASYDSDLLNGAPAVKPAFSNGTKQIFLQQWQFYPVPAHWPNATMEVEPNINNPTVSLSRSFWIANRYYGPDVQLSLYDDEERWTSIVEGRNTTKTYQYLSLRPKDLNNPAQYWFAVCYVCGVEKWNCCKFHNMEAGFQYRIWMNEVQGWGAPLMGTGDVNLGAFDAWTVLYWEEIDPNDGGFEWSIV